VKTEIFKQNCFMWDRHSYFKNLYYFWLSTLAEIGQQVFDTVVGEQFLFLNFGT